MGKRFAIVIGVAAAGVMALGAQTAPAQQQEIGLLFAQTANRGTMKPIEGPTPRFNLKLRGVNSQVVWFQDRPGRQSGDIPVPEFTRSWAGFGFVEDPPNAALTLLHAGDSQDTVVMELGRPHFKKKKNSVRYSAQLLDEATGNLSYLNSDLDPRVNRRFRAPSLFIDDAAARVVNGCVIQPQAKCRYKNLRGANLTGADLSGADLIHADLSGAQLSGARLVGTKLQGANLSCPIIESSCSPGTRTDLSKANLTSAILSSANLTGANLTGASLRLAKLFDANLFYANLLGADMRGSSQSGIKYCHTTTPNGSTYNQNCPR